MDQDFDAREYLSGGNFLKKAELRASGPERLTIQDVAQSAKIFDTSGKPRLVLIFGDGRQYTLSTMVNLKRIVEAWGSRASGWIGKELEVYYSPDVRGPNGEEGGIRIRIPDAPRPAPVRATDDVVPFEQSEFPAGVR